MGIVSGVVFVAVLAVVALFLVDDADVKVATRALCHMVQ